MRSVSKSRKFYTAALITIAATYSEDTNSKSLYGEIYEIKPQPLIVFEASHGGRKKDSTSNKRVDSKCRKKGLRPDVLNPWKDGNLRYEKCLNKQSSKRR